MQRKFNTTHNSLYEINTRVWVKRFGTYIGLGSVPEASWDTLAARGMDLVWLMGVWAGNPDTVNRCCFEPALVAEYRRALPDYAPGDVIGSPYSIDTYDLNPALGDEAELARVRSALNRRGIGLILDFVPNHFSEGSVLIKRNPEVFLPAPESCLARDAKTFFRPAQSPQLILAHGKDPNYDAWGDTVQVNYFSEAGVEFMITQLLKLAERCDGVRCDMAMLMLNDCFERTWGEVLSAGNFKRLPQEFWYRAITAVKARYPQFIFIGEAYWDLEWRLQQQGFDYTYDKTLYDRLRHDGAAGVAGHLRAEPEYQRKLVRFIENHDEPRAAATFDFEQEKAAAVIAGTLMGLRLFYDGQFEGRRVRLPVQLGREPDEALNQELADFYAHLLSALQAPVFKAGQWAMAQVASAGDDSWENFMSYTWRHEGERRLIVVNYAPQPGRCHVRLDPDAMPERVAFRDLLQGQAYTYTKADLRSYGLYIELGGFGSHLFDY